MNTLLKTIFIIPGFCSVLNAQQETANLTGPYLGQKLPGNIPEVFAPGIVSKEGNQAKLSLNPEGTRIIFMSMDIIPGKENEPSVREISFISIQMEDSIWGKPTILPFSRDFINDEPSLSYNGEKLFFVSNRPEDGSAEAQKMPDIWMVTNVAGEWSDPRNIGEPVNTDGVEVQPFYSNDNKLYFGRIDGIYYSQYADGRYSEPVKLDENIFRGRLSGICISPDNKMLIVHSNKEGGSGSWDLYASFKDDSGTWGELINLGKSINTEGAEGNPTFSPDGNILFFSRNGDIYWVSAEIIRELRPKQ